MQFCKTS